MAFLDGKTMLEHARQHQYGVGAFSAHNAETIAAIIEAAEEKRAPIMIQIGQKVIQTLGLRQMKAMVDSFAENATVPIAIHLDHSRQFEQTMEAIQLGFQSVMFDGSARTFEENATITDHVVKAARALGIGSEGEIGKIGGTEDDITVDEKDALITTTAEAVEFVTATDVDYLAVSIGTAHGIYKETPNLRFDRLEEIAAAVQRPIVLHGGSDVPDEQVQRAIQLGVSKINVDTELRQAYTYGLQQYMASNPTDIVLANSLGAGKEVMKQKVMEKIDVFGSAGKAEELVVTTREKVVTL
ncbi:fructose-bisphosphate aldolase [Pontibacillus halophilus JSM 076056 = DSM 19796]|uniref:Fructose-bisphosphate aldolase n=1 Tax=Pontibacillus halophilus JSM 076056 = DSM 19796 TaxID=1385510 RepID=A0A0A5GMF2_9BACI|nr:class II fructose-bisphosphate aldolase [Pontibacillus halophilus]KGX92345.1 fructose-bisphosphate aldolase [Pontibacillus halophilus JSM 076056 = DSM 19796]